MQLSHTRPVSSAVFDDPNLVSSAGLVPMLALARSAGLTKLADQHLSVPTDKGANPGLKVASLVAGMVAGADSIDDMAVLRHGGMGKVFTSAYAPSTLGSFLRSFTFGHVRQLDAVSARFLSGLAATTPVVAGIDDQVMVDIDDTIIEVHGYGKQGSGYGYSGVRGLNAILATLTTKDTAPVIVAQRLRKGSCGSPRGAKRLVTDALATVKKLRTGPAGAKVLLRADSAFYGHGRGRRRGPRRCAGLGHRPARPDGESGHRRHRRRCVGADPVHRRNLRPSHPGVDLGRGGRRDPVHRVRRAEEGQPDPRAARRAPDPRPQPPHRAGNPVRDLAVPRVLHHQHPGHRGRGQDPPRPRDHRTSPRRPEELRPGPPAIGEVHRERGLARPGGDGVQPDPRRSNPGRHLDSQSNDRHDPPQARSRAGPDRVLGATPDTAPAHRVALGERVDHALHRPVRTTTSSRDDLTTAPQALTKKQWNTTDSEVGESVTPSHTINRSGQTRQCHPAHRWIEA